MDRPLLSLCIPTNGVIEWVFPVLDSIYSQNCNDNQFEVVVTDDGDNAEFKRRIKDYAAEHRNLVYAETSTRLFLNEIEAYKRASGELIKFVNHRTLLLEGTLQKLIDFAVEHISEKPIVYFSNGALPITRERHEYTSFDRFVRELSYWSSWSTGMTIWRTDFEKMRLDVCGFNALFPHTDILFTERKREKYIIDNSVILNEMPQGNRPKGCYDLFYAFGVEYIGILLDLLRSGDISADTFRFVKEKNLDLIVDLYWEHIVRKRYCSYDLSGFDDIFGVFYTKSEFNVKCAKHICAMALNRVTGRKQS